MNLTVKFKERLVQRWLRVEEWYTIAFVGRGYKLCSEWESIIEWKETARLSNVMGDNKHAGRKSKDMERRWCFQSNIHPVIRNTQHPIHEGMAFWSDK